MGSSSGKKYFATVPPQEILPIVDSRFESSVKGLFDAPALQQALQNPSDEKIAISYFKYDWALNSQAEPGDSPAKLKSSGVLDPEPARMNRW